MSDTPDGPLGEFVLLADDTPWLSQTLMGGSVPTANEHRNGVYADAEWSPQSTIRKFRMVRHAARGKGGSSE